jgi:hypothetical protein
LLAVSILTKNKKAISPSWTWNQNNLSNVIRIQNT